VTRPAPVLPPPTATPPAATDLRGVARGGLANLAGAAIAGLAGFAVTWLVARGLGKDDAGGFFTGTAAFVMVGVLAKLGTQTSLVYFLSRLRAGGATVSAMRRCVRIGLGPVSVAAVLTGVLMAAFARPLADLTAHGHADHGYVRQLRVLAVFLPLGVLSDTMLAATRGLRTMRPTVMLDRILRPCLQVLVLAGLVLLADERAPLYTAAWVAPYLFSAVLAAVALRERLPADDPDGDPEVTIAPGTFWRFTAPRAVAAFAQLALNRFDVLLLGAMAGLRAAALYAVAGRFIVLGQFANQAVNQSVQPRIAERLAVGDRAGANRLYQTSTGWLVLAVWPLYFGIAVYAKVYLSLFGHGYAKAADVVVVLAGAMLVASGCGMVDVVLVMAGRTSWNLANVVTAVAVNVGVDLVLIPRYGAIGAAIGLACALVANNVIPLAQISAVLRLHPFGRATLLSGALAAICFGLLPALLVAAVGATLWSALAGAALGSALYLGAVARLRTALNIDAFLALRRAGRDRRNEGGA
jgi:O-antigen/teichoic acid export membrane protein